MVNITKKNRINKQCNKYDILFYRFLLLLLIALPSGQRDGGGSGEGRGTGGTLKKGRVERKSAAGPGLSQRSRGVRGVGWEGQMKRWDVVWRADRQEGQLGLSARPILSR